MRRRAGKKYSASPWHHARRALPYLLILCGITCAQAGTIISNLSSGNSGSNGITTTNGWAVSFTMGDIAYMLSDIRIVLSGTGTVSSPIFELESDDGAPEDELVTFVDPAFGALPFGPATFEFNPASPFTLAANTTYWLTAVGTSTVSYHWENSAGALPSGAAATYGGRDESPDGGVTWGGAAANINMFDVEGTSLASTPEPGSAGLAIIGLALFLLGAGRKKLVD